jgi:hypothetical protein
MCSLNSQERMSDSLELPLLPMTHDYVHYGFVRVILNIDNKVFAVYFVIMNSTFFLPTLGARTRGNEQILNQERLAQTLAELSLAYIDSQYPAFVQLLNTIPPTNNAYIDNLNKQLQSISTQSVLPVLTHRPAYFLEYSLDIPIIPANIAINQSIQNIVSIDGQISSGTTQGTVYRVTIQKSNQAKYPYNVSVPAVMKKSPIYDLNTWYKYVQASNSTQSNAKDFVSLYKQQLNKQYNNKNNPAYVDAIGAVALSKLVEDGKSCFFSLCYGTMRCYDYSYFSTTATNTNTTNTAITNSSINKEFPVQLTFLEPLQGSLRSLSLSNWYITNRNTFDCRKFMALFAQVVFGLSIAQREYAFVHNDLHSENILYVRIPENTTLYYYRTSTGYYYAVPSYGHQLKVIDYGRSYLVINGNEINSDELADFFNDGREWTRKNPNNDLIRVVNDVVSELLSDIVKVDAGQVDCFTVMNQFIEHVLTCNAGTAQEYNIIDQYRRCIGQGFTQLYFDVLGFEEYEYDDEEEEPEIGAAEMLRLERTLSPDSREDYLDRRDRTIEECQENILAIDPFADDSGCASGVPSQNVTYFDMFRITALPPQVQLVYLID